MPTVNRIILHRGQEAPLGTCPARSPAAEAREPDGVGAPSARAQPASPPGPPLCGSHGGQTCSVLPETLMGSYNRQDFHKEKISCEIWTSGFSCLTGRADSPGPRVLRALLQGTRAQDAARASPSAGGGAPELGSLLPGPLRSFILLRICPEFLTLSLRIKSYFPRCTS